MKPVDDAEVWSVVCTYVAKEFRGQGIQHRLLAAGLDHARDHGVRLVEAYPVDKPERSHDDFMFFGSRSLYERAGFTEVVRRSPTRVVMRKRLRPLALQATAAERAEKLRGEITRADDNAVTLAAESGEVAIPYEQIVRGNLIYEREQ